MTVAGQRPLGQQVAAAHRPRRLRPARRRAVRRERRPRRERGRGSGRRDRGPTTTGPGPKTSTTVSAAASASSTPPRSTHQPVALDRARGRRARRPPSPGVPRRRGRLRARVGAEPRTTSTLSVLRPPQRAGPREHGLVGSARSTASTHERLESGVPRAARSRRRGRTPPRSRRRPRGRRHDTARWTSGASTRATMSSTLDSTTSMDEPDQVDGLLQGDHPGERPRRRAEHRRRQGRAGAAVGVVGAAAGGVPVDEAA